jgi:hypothetical protein
MMLMKR